jgi:hypothetical protein
MTKTSPGSAWQPSISSTKRPQAHLDLACRSRFEEVAAADTAAEEAAEAVAEVGEAAEEVGEAAPQGAAEDAALAGEVAALVGEVAAAAAAAA